VLGCEKEQDRQTLTQKVVSLLCRKSRSLEVEYETVEAIFFFLSDEEDFRFSSHLFVLPPCKLLPSLKLTSMWIIGAFPVDSAVI